MKCRHNLSVSCLDSKSHVIIFRGAAIDSIKDNIKKMKGRKSSSITARDEATGTAAHSVHNYAQNDLLAF